METIKQSLDYVASQKHSHVGIEHLLLAFTAPESDAAVTRHSDIAGTCSHIREIVLNGIATGDGNGSRSVPQTPAAKQVILDSMKLAESLGHLGVNPEHMFLALLKLDSEPLVRKITDDDNIDVGHLRDQLATASEFDQYKLPVPPKIGG